MSQSAVSLIDKTPKQRLSFHLSEIEKEFDLLLEENAECIYFIFLLIFWSGKIIYKRHNLSKETTGSF